MSRKDYAALTAALVDATAEANHAPMLAHVATPPRGDADERLSIYSDGYRVRLSGAVRADYPALCHYLGTTESSALIDAFIRSTPSAHYSLDYYPLALPGFVARHSPDAFAQDLAVLEGAIAEVFLLPDSEPLTPENFDGDIEGAIFSLRTASRLLSLRFPAETYLTDFRRDGTADKPAAASSHYLILRHKNEVRRHAISPLHHALLSACDGQRDFTAIMNGLQAEMTTIDPSEIQAFFTFIFANGVLRRAQQ